MESELVFVHHNYVDGVCTLCGDDSYFTFTLLEDGTYEVAAKTFDNLPEHIDIPSTYNGIAVTRIAENAFHDTTVSNSWLSRQSMYIPNTIKSIGKDAFLDVYFLGMYICDVNNWVHMELENEGARPDQHPTMCSFTFVDEDDNIIEHIVVPEGVTEIRDYLFAFVEPIETIVLPEGITRIGDEAFSRTFLTDIHIPKSVTYIGYCAFTDNNATITFAGTVEEWDAIEKGTYFLGHTPGSQVICSNGIVTVN